MELSPESKLIEWDDERHSTDIDRFDEQHQYLFGLLNELYVAMDEDATAYAIREGWYHTGDIGTFDDSGSLKIVGSK